MKVLKLSILTTKPEVVVLNFHPVKIFFMRTIICSIFSGVEYRYVYLCVYVSNILEA